jgi:hypothetical protein
MTSLNGNTYPYFDETRQYQYGTLDSGNTAFMLAVTGENSDNLTIIDMKLILRCLFVEDIVRKIKSTGHD